MAAVRRVFPMPVMLLGPVVPWFVGCSPDWSWGACTARQRLPAVPGTGGHGGGQPATHLSRLGKQG